MNTLWIVNEYASTRNFLEQLILLCDAVSIPKRTRRIEKNRSISSKKWNLWRPTITLEGLRATWSLMSSMIALVLITTIITWSHWRKCCYCWLVATRSTMMVTMYYHSTDIIYSMQSKKERSRNQLNVRFKNEIWNFSTNPLEAKKCISSSSLEAWKYFISIQDIRQIKIFKFPITFYVFEKLDKT